MPEFDAVHRDYARYRMEIVLKTMLSYVVTWDATVNR